MTDRIEIRGLRVLAAHGALPGEQAKAQPFELDLDVEVDAARASASDDLSDAVDYGKLAEVAAAAAGGGPHKLLETIAEAVAAAVLGDPGVLAVTVAVRKLRPPMALDVATVAVRITRRAAS